MASDNDAQSQPHAQPSTQPTAANLKTEPAILSDDEKNTAQSKPNDAKTIEAILKSMGVDQFDPRVTQQLLELLYRHVTNVLFDARQFSEHADKQLIDADDIKMALQSKNSSTFAQPISREVMAKIAVERNSIPLPSISDRQGIQLPNSILQLTQHNYRVAKLGKRQRLSSLTENRSHAQKPISNPSSNPVIVLDDDPPPRNTVQPPPPQPPTSTPQPMEVVNAGPNLNSVQHPPVSAPAAPTNSATVSPQNPTLPTGQMPPGAPPNSHPQ